jgi:CheY-like chemotaxis protein
MALTGARVLVVEDEDVVRMMMEEFLDDLGCEVVGTAKRLEDGMEKANSLDLDIALLDLNLSGRKSYPIAATLRGRRIPFVFATGYGIDDMPAELSDVPVVPKPFRQEQLALAMVSAWTPVWPD